MSNDYKVGLYIRLSKEDNDRRYQKESESIVNQRNLLLKYIKQNNYSLTSEYVDDGYSGTTFDRPGFNKLISDIESGKINMVITKDLSRLGRDYIKSGYYVEEYFPSKKVRYISVLDNIDTLFESASNDIAPFKALFNDMVSKDTSKKIKAILRNKKEQGLFIGNSASFGYQKDPKNKHKLIIDKKTAPIVIKIFKLALSGKTNKEICNILNENKIMTPLVYKNTRISSRIKEPMKWTTSSIQNILKNPVYTGDLVQNVQAKLSYKSKKRIILDKSLWSIKENTHPPLIDKETFELVNSKILNPNKKRLRRLLEGFLFCFECQSPLGICYQKNRNTWTIQSNNYKKNPKLKKCSSHYMNYDDLEKIIIKEITIKNQLKTIERKALYNLIKKIYVNKNKKIEILYK